MIPVSSELSPEMGPGEGEEAHQRVQDSCSWKGVLDHDQILEQFKPLKCSICGDVVLFQHRTMGTAFCTGLIGSEERKVEDTQAAESGSPNSDNVSVSEKEDGVTGDEPQSSLNSETGDIEDEVVIPNEVDECLAFVLGSQSVLIGIDQPVSDEIIHPVIPEAALERGWTPLTPSEEKELADICSKSIFAKDTKELLESAMHDLSLGENPNQMYNHYVFKLDNAERQEDFTYTLQDLPLNQAALVKGEMEFEITKFTSLTEIVVLPTAEVFRNMDMELCDKIDRWMGARNKQELEGLRPSRVLKEDEMCIVQWPRFWEEVSNIMKRLDDKDEEAWWYENLEENCKLNIFYKDYEKFAGEWFRAASVVPYYNAEAKIELYEMFMVDLGITTLILAKDIYRIPHRLMLDCQLSLFAGVKLDGTTQYSHEVDEKWKYLLLPGMKIKAKVLWMFDENNVIRLIKPSQSEFEEHFRKPSVVAAIQQKNDQTREHQRHRKVKKMSVLKGSFPANLKKVLAQEAEEKTLKEARRDYSGIGSVHPDQIFKLCLPKPIR